MGRRMAVALVFGGITAGACAAEPLPEKLRITRKVDAEFFLNGEAKGTVGVPEGTEFHPDGIDGDRVYVDTDGSRRLYAPLDATNFKEALPGARERAAALAGARDGLLKDAVELEIKVGKIVPVGIVASERREGGKNVKAQVFVASVSAGAAKEGDWWKGTAYPLGLAQHPNTGETVACFTGSLEEYHAFKIGREDVVKTYTNLAKERGTKPKLDFDDLSKLVSMLDLDRVYQLSARLRTFGADDKPEGGDGFKVSNEQILRLQAREARITMLREIYPGWVKASELAGFWLKNREMPAPVREWLKLMQETTLHFNSNDIGQFRNGVNKLNGDWLSLSSLYAG